MPEWLLPPNLLTLGRIALTPFIGLAVARNDYRLALPLIFFASITDAFDGYLARRYRWHSPLGEKLDPLADKLMLATAYIALWQAGKLPGWLTALVLGRDFLILAFAAAAFATKRVHRLPPTVWGKLSTIFQMMLAGSVILVASFHADALGPMIRFAGIPVTAALTAWSAVHYAWTGTRLWRGRGV